MEQIARFPDGDRIPVFAQTAINAGRFVQIKGAKTSRGDYPAGHCTAAERAFGVAEADSAAATEPAHSVERMVNVIRPKAIARVECVGEVAVLDEVEVGADGKAAAFDSGVKVGQALTAGEDSIIEVELY